MKSLIRLSLLACVISAPTGFANTVFSWETDLEGWVPAEGAALAVTPEGATDGTQALEITTPMSAMWWSTPASIALDETLRPALFGNATEIKLDVSFVDPGFTSWFGAPSVELIIQGDCVNWTQLGAREVAIGGEPQTVSWPLTLNQAESLANGGWAHIILKFTYGNGGATATEAVFRVDNLRSTVVIVEAPEPTFYWKGGEGDSWTGANWTIDAEGVLAAGALPADGSAVVGFHAAEADNFFTVVGADQHVAGLVFLPGSDSVDIGGSHDLTLGAGGLFAEAGAGSAYVNTTGSVILAEDQMWRNRASGFLTVESTISGPGRLSLRGTGTTYFTGTNTYTGGTFLEQGTLLIEDPQALGAPEADLTLDGGTLDLNGYSPTVGGLSGPGGTIANTGFDPAVFTVNADEDATFGGIFRNLESENPLGLVKAGGGTLTLSGQSSFSGDVTVQEGVLSAATWVDGAPVIGSLGNSQLAGRTITVESGAHLLFSMNNVFGGNAADPDLLPNLVVAGGTVDSTRYNQLGPITLDGAILTQSSSDNGDYQGYQFLGDVTVIGSLSSIIDSPNGKANHLSALTVFDVADVTGDEWEDLHVLAPLANRSADYTSGPGGLLKTGSGTMKLSGANTYTGPTFIEAGTLVLDTPTLADTAEVEIAAGAVLELNHIEDDVVGLLILDNEVQEPGIYGAVDSGAEFETPFITGDGRLVVAALPEDPYLAWIAGFPALEGADAEKSADPDGDGSSNFEEFALNADPTDGAASGKVRSRVEEVDGGLALVLTFPVRDGAVFSGNAPAAATVDGVVYQIGGSDDLAAFDESVSEVTPALAENPALPAVDAGWTYRTFRLDGAIDGESSRGPKGFLRVALAEAP